MSFDLFIVLIVLYMLSSALLLTWQIRLFARIP